jgi:hypothetical protein
LELHGEIVPQTGKQYWKPADLTVLSLSQAADRGWQRSTRIFFSRLRVRAMFGELCIRISVSILTRVESNSIRRILFTRHRQSKFEPAGTVGAGCIAMSFIIGVLGDGRFL